MYSTVAVITSASYFQVVLVPLDSWISGHIIVEGDSLYNRRVGEDFRSVPGMNQFGLIHTCSFLVI